MTKRRAGALVLLALSFAADAAFAADGYYYRNVQPRPASGSSSAPPDGSTNDGPSTGGAPALAATGAPTGRSTVGDGVSVSFMPSGFGGGVVLEQSGPDVPGLRFQSNTGILSGNLSTPGLWTFTATATEGARSATASTTFDIRYFPPAIGLTAPSVPVFAGIPFTFPAKATNGASVSSWTSVGAGSSVAGDGTVTVDAPIGSTQANLTVTGTDAWNQAGTAAIGIPLTPPAASAAIPAAMRGGHTYPIALSTNLPSPAWTASGATGGSASVTGSTLSLSPPSVTADTAYGVTVTARSGKATAASALSSRIVPPFAIAAQPAGTTVMRGSGFGSYPPPATKGELGTRSYALLKGGSDVSDSLGSLCPGYSFSRPTGVVSGTSGTSTCYQTLAYAITDPGDAAVGPTTATSSTFLFSVLSNTTFAQQPASVSVEQNGTATVTASLNQDGAYVAPLQFWNITNGQTSSEAKPAWITKSCPLTAATCTLTVAPTASIATGTYGPYAIMAADATGFYKASSTFNVTVLPPSAQLVATGPAKIAQAGPAGSACTAVTVRNASATAATGLSVSLASTADFQTCTLASNQCGTTLAANATCGFGVILKAPAEGDKATTATVTATNAASPQTVAVTGNYTADGTASYQVFATPGTYTFTPKSPGQVVRVLVVNGGNGGFGPWGSANGMGGGSGRYASNASYATSGPVTVVVGAGTAGGNYSGGNVGAPSGFGNVTVTASGSNTTSMDGGSGGGGFPGQPGGTAGSSGSGTYSDSSVRPGQGQGTVPNLSVFKANTLSYGAGGLGGDPASTQGSGGGGGVLINGVGGNATQGNPGGASVSNALAGKPGQGYGAGGGGGYYAGGSANLSAGYGGRGSDGLVYVEWTNP